MKFITIFLFGVLAYFSPVESCSNGALRSNLNHYVEGQSKPTGTYTPITRNNNWRIPTNSLPDMEWSYRDIDEWGVKFPTCASGQLQSPINLETRTRNVLADLDLVFHDYTNNPVSGSLSNSNNFMRFELTRKLHIENMPSITAWGLDGNYKLAEIEFHWGHDSSPGSEHTVNGRGFPVEVHFIHTVHTYMEESLKHPNGVAIVAFFLQAGTRNAQLDYSVFTDKLASLTSDPTAIEIDDIGSLIPSEALAGTARFFRYSGSLTTPPCSEAVAWSVFADPINLSQEEMDQFLLVTDENAVHHRPTQPVGGGRVVMVNRRF